MPGFKATTPFARGVEEIMAWFDADPARQVVNREKDRTMETIIAAYRAAFPA